jgi:large subunit ribosomal protein L24
MPTAVFKGKCRIKKGDTVMVMAGRERGKMGKVLTINLRKGRVTVEKLNMVKRHTKPSQKNRQGGILEREAPLAISNVMPYCGAVQKPSRVRVKILEGGQKIRVFQKAPDEPLDKA